MVKKPKNEKKEPERQPTAEERIDKELAGRIGDLERMWLAEMNGIEGQFHPCNGCEEVFGDEDEATAHADEEGHKIGDELGPLSEYGLSFDYVAPGTFTDQLEGYWRYQLSTGGPGDEFRFYASSPTDKCYRVEYWFLDWGDGAKRNVRGRDIIQKLWDWFQDAGVTKSTYDAARKE